MNSGKDSDKPGWFRFIKQAMQSAFSKESLDNIGNGITSTWNRLTGSALTNADVQANEMTMQNQEDIFQRQVAGMQKAGLNPALMYGSSPSSAPTAQNSSGSSGASLSDLMQIIAMRKQMKVLDSQAEKNRLDAQAALTTARAAERNAGANERNAESNALNAETNKGSLDVSRFNSITQRMNAETEKLKASFQKTLADSQVKVNEAEEKRILGQLAFINIQAEQLPMQLEIARGNMQANQRQAAAALANAQAAARNAAVNEKLSDSAIALRNAQAAIEWAKKDGQEIVNKYLDERQQRELANLEKEGIKLDAQGRLVDKQGRLVDAQMVKTYANVATDISGAVNQWINPFSKGPGSSSAPQFDLSGAYQGVAYGYD